MERIDRDKSLFMELVRFVVIGVYGTLIDFAIEGGLHGIPPTGGNSASCC